MGGEEDVAERRIDGMGPRNKLLHFLSCLELSMNSSRLLPIEIDYTAADA